MKNRDMKTGHPGQSDSVPKPKLKNKQYIKELRKLQTELVQPRGRGVCHGVLHP
jgi:hypothetical protein